MIIKVKKVIFCIFNSPFVEKLKKTHNITLLTDFSCKNNHKQTNKQKKQ